MKLIITESQNKGVLKNMLEKHGMKIVCKLLGKTPEEVVDEIGITGTKEDILYLTKILFLKDIGPTFNYCNYNIIPTRYSMELIVYITKPLPENVGRYMFDQAVRNTVYEHVSDLIYKFSGGIIRGHNIYVMNTGDC
jgi:hypothetical protein